jgi:uncharacterized membrane protein
MTSILALRLIFGMACLWMIMPRSSVAPGSFRIQLGIAFVAAAIATVNAGQIPLGSAIDINFMVPVFVGLCCTLVGTTLLGMICWSRRWQSAGVVCMMLTGMFATIAMIIPLLGVTRGHQELTASLFNAVSSGLSLGAITTSAVLLLETVLLTRQDEKAKVVTYPLLKLTVLTGFFVIVRIFCVILAPVELSNPHPDTAAIFTFHFLGLAFAFILTCLSFRFISQGRLSMASLATWGAFVLIYGGEIAPEVLNLPHLVSGA